MMNFDNRSGGQLYTTNATHGPDYQKKLKDLRENYEIQQTVQSANQAGDYAITSQKHKNVPR